MHELVNEHRTVRKFLGHTDIWDHTRYGYQTMVDHVSLLTPEVLGKVSQLIAEKGHAMVRKRKDGTNGADGADDRGRRRSDDPLRGRCDSFVVKTDVHYPTDVHLLWDAMRCLVRDLSTGHA